MTMPMNGGAPMSTTAEAQPPPGHFSNVLARAHVVADNSAGVRDGVIEKVQLLIGPEVEAIPDAGNPVSGISGEMFAILDAIESNLAQIEAAVSKL